MEEEEIIIRCLKQYFEIRNLVKNHYNLNENDNISLGADVLLYSKERFEMFLEENQLLKIFKLLYNMSEELKS